MGPATSGQGINNGHPAWSVFDGVKTIPPAPETLMSEINAAIAAFEYSRSSAALLASPPSSSSNNNNNNQKGCSDENPPRRQFDVRAADEAYKAGCAALAAGKLDDALHYLNVSLSKCPPHKTSAVAKLQSLISLTSRQLNKSPN